MCYIGLLHLFNVNHHDFIEVLNICRGPYNKFKNIARRGRDFLKVYKLM